MQKRRFVAYILTLFVIFLFALVSWQDRWINIDIGSFHYHKMWEGPSLSDMSFGLVDYTLDLPMGRDFVGGSKLRMKVDNEMDEVNDERLDQTVETLRNRLSATGFAENTVYREKTDKGAFIVAEILADLEKVQAIESVILSDGLLELWTQKENPEPQKAPNNKKGADLSFKEMMMGQYDDLGVDITGLKGFGTGQTEEGYTYLDIGLTDAASDNVTKNFQQFYGKSLTAVLGESFLFVDETFLGEQYQMSGSVRSMRFLILGEEVQARAQGATIKYNDLPLDLTVTARSEFRGPFDFKFIQKGVFVGFILISLFSIFLIYKFRREGLIGSTGLILYILAAISMSKVLHITLSIPSLMAFLYGVGFFAGSILLGLVKSRQDEEEVFFNVSVYLKSNSFTRIFKPFVLVNLIASSVVLILLPGGIKFLAAELLLVTFMMWLFFEYGMRLITFVYNITQD